MADTDAKPKGPDLTKGVTLAAFADNGMLSGHVGDEEVLLVKRGAEVFAIAPQCTHYHGPLADGLVVDGTIRCPWHHACFDLKSGEALHAPAIDPLDCWKVERRDETIFVREKMPQAGSKAKGKPRGSDQAPSKIVIAGGGAAGFAAAEMLRRHDYQGEIIMVSDDAAPPVDRPNLSKDYLAGNAPEEWVPLRPDDYYAANGIQLRLGTAIGRVLPRDKQVVLADGGTIAYDRLLIATGAEPIRLTLPGLASSDVFTLRSLADSRAIIARAEGARQVVVLGASFIGLQVAASLRARGLEVHVVAPEARPLEKVLGPQFGDFVRSLHEQHGVVFHLGRKPGSIDAQRVTLDDGSTLAADLVVIGVGVRPRLELAEKAGLTIDRGIVVNEQLETSVPGIFAAGDVARWPDHYSGKKLRIEHWVVAERQGQVAALNMLGRGERFAAAPFFWSQHYDISIDYVGHAAQWDRLDIDGDMAAHDVAVRYRKNGRTMAVAVIFRGEESLKAEIAMEHGISP